MDEKDRSFPSEESIRNAMELAWKDHHHARDQTWKTIQIVSVLGAGLLTIDFQYKSFFPTLCASILVIISAWFGILIAWNHRKLEKRKFIHIMNCEELLGLHRDDLIPLHPGDDTIKKKTELIKDSAVKVPNKFKVLDAINPKKNNTALFILRMHIAIMLFAMLVLMLRYYDG